MQKLNRIGFEKIEIRLPLLNNSIELFNNTVSVNN